MISLYNSGDSYDQIAQKIGKSARWVGVVLRSHITPRPRSQKKVVAVERIPWQTKAERDLLAIRLYQSGKGALTVSRQLGISKKTVFKILADNGIPTDKNRRSGTLTEEQIQQAVELYDSGMSTSQVAKQFGVCPDTIAFHVRKRSQARNPADTMSIIPVEHQEEIKRLYTEEKLSSYKLADKFNVHINCMQAFLKRHGILVKAFTPQWQEAVNRGIESGGSSLEATVEKYLQEMGLPYNRQSIIGPFRYDFGLLDDSVLVEVQGSYWHSSAQRRQRDAYKRRLANKHGKKLVVIWDYEIKNKQLVQNRIQNAISKSDFDFKQCEVRLAPWEEAKNLLDKYHYQRAGRSGKCVGAYLGDKLVAVVVYALPTRQETADKQNLPYSDVLELTRFCIHPTYQARNFATWLLARSYRFLDCQLLVSFADPTFGHTGTIYRAANWELDGETPASYWYYNGRTDTIYHKKSIWNSAKRSGVTEEAYYKSKHLLKVWGQPKIRFIKRLW